MGIIVYILDFVILDAILVNKYLLYMANLIAALTDEIIDFGLTDVV